MKTLKERTSRLNLCSVFEYIYFRKLKHYRNTHPVGCADSLVVDAVALLRQQRGVPVAVIGLVVPHSEGLWRMDASGGELSSEVVLGV